MTIDLKRPSGDGYNDLERYQVQKGYVLEFYHIPTGRKLQFKALITQFSDQYESTWKSEDVYGRNDPIENFQGTKRVITLGWDVIAATLTEAKINLGKCGLLFSMLYPTYTEKNNAGSIAAAPLFKMKFANLIQDVKTKSGLVCRISGFTYEPDLEQGLFDPRKGILYPQAINLQASFTIFHTNPLGWSTYNNSRTEKFPYGEEHPGRARKPVKEQPNSKAGTKNHQEAIKMALNSPYAVPAAGNQFRTPMSNPADKGNK